MASLARAWKALRSGKNALTLDDPKHPDRELGCYHRRFASTVDSKPVRAIEYDMRDFMKSCVSQYQEVTGTVDKKLRYAETPFITIPGG